jgi:hypothetical protein
LQAKDIAKALHMSRRNVFRRRANAIRAIVDFGSPRGTVPGDERAADGDAA